MILALDLATTTGYAVFNLKGQHIKSGIWKLTGNPQHKRFTEFIDCLSKLLEDKTLTIKTVYFEKPVGQWQNRDAASLYFGLEANLLSFCDARDLRTGSINPSTLKKYATGNGRAKKPQIKKAAIRKFPDVKVIDHNHADALFIGLYGVLELYEEAEHG